MSACANIGCVGHCIVWVTELFAWVTVWGLSVTLLFAYLAVCCVLLSNGLASACGSIVCVEDSIV